MELFQDIDDPVAAAEGENVMSQMRSAELQLVTELEGNNPETLEEASFEREAVTIQAQDDFESSSIEAEDNRSVCPCKCWYLDSRSMYCVFHTVCCNVSQPVCISAFCCSPSWFVAQHRYLGACAL